MTSNKGSYRQIFKATSLFGGVQVFNIIIGIIRSKIVAVLLGASGMGVLGLFTTTIAMVQSITGLGLSSSAVRDISEANGSGNSQKIASSIKILRRWVWATGLFGSVATVALAPLLSKWTFGNEEYTWAFIWLSVTLLLNALSSGQTSLLQGMRRLKDMAKSSMLGSLVGLITSIPLYYFFGIKGIVPALIVTAATALLLSSYFARRVSVAPVKQTWHESYKGGINMAKLGIAMMFSGFMVTLVSYVTNLFVSRTGGVSDVGMYRAAWTISAQYVGLVFTAMATDYFPRLAGLNNDSKAQHQTVNQQAEIALLILGPMLVTLIGFAPLLVRLLYTPEFLPIRTMICWNMIGIPFKAASWALGFLVIAKGNSKLYFITETLANAIMLLFNILGYMWGGLAGLGFAFFASYAAYLAIMAAIAYRAYGFRFDRLLIRIFVLQLAMVSATFAATFIVSTPISYAIIVIALIASTIYTLKEVNKRLNILEVVKKFRNK